MEHSHGGYLGLVSHSFAPNRNRSVKDTSLINTASGGLGDDVTSIQLHSHPQVLELRLWRGSLCNIKFGVYVDPPVTIDLFCLIFTLAIMEIQLCKINAHFSIHANDFRHSCYR